MKQFTKGDHHRSSSQNDHNYRSPQPQVERQEWKSYRDKLEDEDILRERARRFVARMRKQKEYTEGKYVLKRQIQEKRRQQEQILLQSVMFQKQVNQKSRKMSMALEKILINECKKQKRMIQQLSQKMRSQSYTQNGQSVDLPQRGQKIVAKRFSTVESQKINVKQQSSNMIYLPPIDNLHESKQQIEALMWKHAHPARPKKQKQIFLTKADQIKLKSIDDKIKKLNQLYSQAHDRQP